MGQATYVSSSHWSYREGIVKHPPLTDEDTKALRPYILPRIARLIRRMLTNIVYCANSQQRPFFCPCFPSTNIWWCRVFIGILGRCCWLRRVETRNAQRTAQPPQRRTMQPKMLTVRRVRSPSLLQSPLKLKKLYLATSPALDYFIITQYDASLIP